jgi:hypothetical protein
MEQSFHPPLAAAERAALRASAPHGGANPYKQWAKASDRFEGHLTFPQIIMHNNIEIQDDEGDGHQATWMI